MTLPTAGRLVRHCGEHTTKPQPASGRRFLITTKTKLLISVARVAGGGGGQSPKSGHCCGSLCRPARKATALPRGARLRAPDLQGRRRRGCILQGAPGERHEALARLACSDRFGREFMGELTAQFFWDFRVFQLQKLVRKRKRFVALSHATHSLVFVPGFAVGKLGNPNLSG